MRFWNIGGEGQFIMGAICAPRLPTSWARSCPSPCGAGMALCGILGGGLYG